jgi:DNA-damage-inducible protein J
MSDIRVFVPDELKSNVQAILKQNDMTISQAVRMFLREVEKGNGLPFNPYEKKELNSQTKASIETSMNPENLESFESSDDLFSSWGEDK